MTTTRDTQDQPLRMERTFDCPIEEVWAAWTEPERFKQWYGPSDHTIPYCTMDVRVGGTFHYCMRGPQGGDFWATGTYRVVERPERLAMSECSADDKGNVVPMSHYGMPWDEPMEMELDLVFAEAADGGTQLTLSVTGLPPGDARDGAAAGWQAAFEKLAKLLEGNAPA